MWWILRTGEGAAERYWWPRSSVWLLAMMMVGAVVRGLMIQLRQSRVDQQCLQSLWLAESGAARAAAALAADASYSGEIWQLSVPTAAGPVAGSVEIVVRAAADQSAARGTDPGPLAPQYVDPRQLPQAACHPASRAGRCFMNSLFNSRIADAEGRLTRYPGFPATVPALPAIQPPSRWSSCWS